MVTGNFQGRTGFPPFTLLNDTPPQGYSTSRIYVVRGDINEHTSNVQACKLMAKSMVKHVKRILSKKKNIMGQQKKRSSKNARRMRGTYHMDPEDLEFKETFKNVRRTLELHMESAISCKSYRSSGNTTLKTSKVSWQEHGLEAIPRDSTIHKTVYVAGTLSCTGVWPCLG